MILSKLLRLDYTIFCASYAMFGSQGDQKSYR
jgi:hypothetical protein